MELQFPYIIHAFQFPGPEYNKTTEKSISMALER